MTDPLTPEDRALYDAFFVAYKEKFAELHAAAGDGAQVTLDVCTVHSIKAMTAREIDNLREAFEPSLRMLEKQSAECFPEINALGQKHFVRVVMESAAEEIRAALSGPHRPRIVSAVGVGVRVKRDDEEVNAR